MDTSTMNNSAYNEPDDTIVRTSLNAHKTLSQFNATQTNRFKPRSGLYSK